MHPDAMNVGDNLEETLSFVQLFQELYAKLQSNRNQITNSVLKLEPISDIGLLWLETDRYLETREKLLLQSVKFHKSARSFTERMNKATFLFDNTSENEITNPELGYQLIDQHQSTKKDILESSLITFEEGKELLMYMKEMSISSDSMGKQTTSNACHTIESLLEVLNDRRRYIEDLWNQRKSKLEQCIQICFLKEEIKNVISFH
jgi:hypothetical protein